MKETKEINGAIEKVKKLNDSSKFNVAILTHVNSLEEAVEKVPMIKEHTEFCEWMEKYEKQEEDTLEETTEQTMEENIVETVE